MRIGSGLAAVAGNGRQLTTGHKAGKVSPLKTGSQKTCLMMHKTFHEFWEGCDGFRGFASIPGHFGEPVFLCLEESADILRLWCWLSVNRAGRLVFALRFYILPARLSCVRKIGGLISAPFDGRKAATLFRVGNPVRIGGRPAAVTEDENGIKPA